MQKYCLVSSSCLDLPAFIADALHKVAFGFDHDDPSPEGGQCLAPGAPGAPGRHRPAPRSIGTFTAIQYIYMNRYIDKDIDIDIDIQYCMNMP